MARKKRSVTYLVSGDANIHPSHEVLRKAKRTVRYDTEVNEAARVELKAGQSFVVVAHGNAEGTVTWFSSARGNSSPWLWVGMPKPPRDSHLYIYACKAGRRLRPFLAQCEVLGHVDVVPMPVERYRTTVLRFLTKVDRLIANPTLNPDDWACQLAQFVNVTLAAEAEKANASWRKVATMMMLRRSMAHAD